jgi:adenylate kinase family enzyme
MNTITAHPTTIEQAEALKAVMKVLKIKFKVVDEKEYDPEFVNKITESRKQAKEGRVTRVAKKDLKKLLGLP